MRGWWLMMVNLFKEVQSLWKKHAYLCKIHFLGLSEHHGFLSNEGDAQTERKRNHYIFQCF